METTELYDTAHHAISARRWGLAKCALVALAARNDNPRELPNAPAGADPVIQDLIDCVNYAAKLVVK